MGVNFKHLLARPAGQAERPKALPAGDYPGIIAKFEQGESSQKKTPYVRFLTNITGWPDTVEEEDRVLHKPDGTTSPIDLSKKQQKVDYYLTDDALWRLDEFIRSAGLETAGKSYEEIIPECVGVHVTLAITQENNDTGDEVVTYNKVGKMVGQQ
jgi:hypothetical protein